MRVVAGEIFPLQLPFRLRFSHAGRSRGHSDSLILKLRSDDGTVGFGEAVARPYVTGETVASCMGCMANVMWPSVSRTEYEDIAPGPDPLESLRPIATSLPECSANGVIACHGARAAFEAALLDLILKRQNLSLASVLVPRRSVIYSGIVGLGSMAATMAMVGYFKCLGLSHFKLKIADRDHLHRRLRLTRVIIGRRCSLRLDANGAFTPQQAATALAEIEGYGIACVEQPIPRGEPEVFARLQRAVAVPLMADESLVTLDDARRLADSRACDYFNLRLAKCGGVFNTLAIARLAAAAGIRIQLGCQVGETAILAALGRHVAAHLDRAEFVEGSYGSRLLTEDLATQPVGFGWGGRPPALDGPGIGVRINETVLRKHSHQPVILGGN